MADTNCTGIPPGSVKYSNARYYRILFPIMQTVLIIGGIALALSTKGKTVIAPFMPLPRQPAKNLASH